MDFHDSNLVGLSTREGEAAVEIHSELRRSRFTSVDDFKSMLEEYRVDINKLHLVRAAVENGNSSALGFLLQQPGVDVNLCHDRVTPLMGLQWIPTSDALECAAVLLNHPTIDVNYGQRTNRGTALHQIASNCNADLIRRFLQHPNINVNAIDSTGDTPICRAYSSSMCEAFLQDYRASLSPLRKQGSISPPEARIVFATSDKRTKGVFLHYETKRRGLLRAYMRSLREQYLLPDEIIESFLMPFLKDEILSPQQRKDWQPYLRLV